MQIVVRTNLDYIATIDKIDTFCEEERRRYGFRITISSFYDPCPGRESGQRIVEFDEPEATVQIFQSGKLVITVKGGKSEYEIVKKKIRPLLVKRDGSLADWLEERINDKIRKPIKPIIKDNLTWAASYLLTGLIKMEPEITAHNRFMDSLKLDSREEVRKALNQAYHICHTLHTKVINTILKYIGSEDFDAAVNALCNVTSGRAVELLRSWTIVKRSKFVT